MNKMSSFQSANFVMKQKVKNSGNIIIKVSEEDMQLVGKMTNTLGYDLNNCMIYYQGNLLYIEAADMYLYDKGIDVGDKVIIQDNLLVKAGQE